MRRGGSSSWGRPQATLDHSFRDLRWYHRILQSCYSLCLVYDWPSTTGVALQYDEFWIHYGLCRSHLADFYSTPLFPRVPTSTSRPCIHLKDLCWTNISTAALFLRALLATVFMMFVARKTTQSFLGLKFRLLADAGTQTLMHGTSEEKRQDKSSREAPQKKF